MTYMFVYMYVYITYVNSKIIPLIFKLSRAHLYGSNAPESIGGGGCPNQELEGERVRGDEPDVHVDVSAVGLSAAQRAKLVAACSLHVQGVWSKH